MIYWASSSVNFVGSLGSTVGKFLSKSSYVLPFNSINSKFIIIKGEPNKIIILSGEVVFDKDLEVLKQINFEDIASEVAKQI